MNNGKFHFKADKAGFALGAVLLITTLAGCAGYMDGPRPVGYVPPPDVTLAAQDDYVYYPGYDVYYNTVRREYGYQEGGQWVSRPAPGGVSVAALQASPYVRMDFHDSPANHHAETVQKYPKNWTPNNNVR